MLVNMKILKLRVKTNQTELVQHLPDILLEVEWFQVQHSCRLDWPIGKPTWVPLDLPLQLEPGKPNTMNETTTQRQTQIPQTSNSGKYVNRKNRDKTSMQRDQDMAHQSFSGFWSRVTCIGPVGGPPMEAGIKPCNGSVVPESPGSLPSCMMGLQTPVVTPLYSGESRTPNTCWTQGMHEEGGRATVTGGAGRTTGVMHRSS